MRTRHGIAILVALALAGCGGGDGGDGGKGGSEPTAAPESLGTHVHGLGVDPRDQALYVATHDGLYRSTADRPEPDRVGTRHRDTMGFTVVGPNRFVASGHPTIDDLRDGLKPFLGLMETRNAGRSWRSLSLMGEIDFHALDAQDRVVYGSGTEWKSRESRFLVSKDSGRTWTRRQPPEPIVSIAVDPGDSQHVIASGSDGVHISEDSGGSWRPVDAPAGLVAYGRAGSGFLVDADGRVMRSDGDAKWQAAGDVGGQAAAFTATAAGELYVATHDGQIKRSTDGGRSWTLRTTLRD